MEQKNQVQKAQTNKPAPTQKERVDILKGIMNADSVKEQFQNALQRNAPKFIASVIDLYNSDSKLQECDPKAVVMECLKAAVLNLPITKAMGQAYIIPYKNKKTDAQGKVYYVTEPTFQIGYKGLIQLALRSGMYRTINSGCVYDGWLRKGSRLTGEFDLEGEQKSDEIIGYFAYIEQTNGFKKGLFMTVEQVIDHATRFSKALTKWENGKPVVISKDALMALAKLPMNESSKAVGWTGNFHSMAIKTCLRNLLSKYGNLSVDVNMATAIDNDLNGEIQQIKAQESIDVQDAEIVNMEDASFEEIPVGQEVQDAEKIEAGF